jgi:hypothetical protein
LRTQIAPELLAKQGFDIGFIIDDEDTGAQLVPPFYVGEAALRGSVTMR